MALIDLEDKILEIVNKENNKDFIFDFLNIYDIPKATVTKLRSGTNNLSKKKNEFHLKNKLYFKETDNEVFESFANLEEEVQSSGKTPRYLLVTDYTTLLAKDTQTMETLDILYKELPLHFDFFLAWNGIEKVDFQKENPLDIKAAERFARLFDVLNKEIDSNNASQRHALNIFLMRLLFCLFAEDTGIFKKNLFTNGIKKYTDESGQDVNQYIEGLFKVLDLPSRDGVDTIYVDFPYVNGQLFTELHKHIPFNYKARKLMIECGELLEWSKINPDIFGSMIQAVATENSRSHLGMHYTSVPNIMKVISPLFLEELQDRFSEINTSWHESIEEKKLDKYKIKGIRKKYNDQLSDLMSRIRNMKFFDPACGSGNFLIITYKELRKLEIEIYKLVNIINNSQMLVYEPIVTLTQFYGIEIDEFASDIAKLSLWITEHQMNLELKDALADVVRPTLPLKSAGDIRCSNALQEDWNSVCPHEEFDEVYLFGNPPYLGARLQDSNHKSDMDLIFSNEIKGYKNLDYISAWFFKGSLFIRDTISQLAFVTTNSISQGEQVGILWDRIFEMKLVISYCYTSFKWGNNAKHQAGVTVSIIGLKSEKTITKERYIYTNNTKKIVDSISPYLVPGNGMSVKKVSKSISKLPELLFGSMPNDGGNLVFSNSDASDIVLHSPELKRYFKRFMGSREFINSELRYCLWLSEENYRQLNENFLVNNIVEKVAKHRLGSKRLSTKKLAEKPYLFGEIRYSESPAIIIPATSSENREYIPMGIVDSNTVISNSAYALYNSELYLLGLLMSRMHMVWVRSIGGRLKTDYRYSAGLCYNTFPVSEISTQKKNKLEHLVLQILDIREESGQTLSYLYNKKTMPLELKKAHEVLDKEVDKIYKQAEFYNDEERLEKLLSLYEAYTNDKILR